MQKSECSQQQYGSSISLCDYILRQQLQSIRPRTVVDFGAGGGKNGRIVKQLFPENVDILAVEGCQKTAAMLPTLGFYDQVTCELIGDWAKKNTSNYDVAIFGDVLEHLKPNEIHEILSICIKKFKDIIIICPLHDIFQGEAYDNPLEIHQTYIHSKFFDKYNCIEKHIAKGRGWIIMNVHIQSQNEASPKLILLSRSIFHATMLALQPFGLARPLVNILQRYAKRYKWIIGR